VQGVNFRNSIKGYASSKDIKGYVANRKDGSVLIVAQGRKEALQSLISWIKNSPGLSKVDSLQYTEKEPKARYDGFEVIRERNFFVDQAKSFLNLGKTLITENENKIPEHIVIIPDGNRRWARERGLFPFYGHQTAGSMNHIIALLDEAKKQGVKYFSIWGFSTENWNRDKAEIKAIFDLVLKSVDKLKEEAHKHRIRFRHIGRKDRLPKELLAALEQLEEETGDYGEFNVQLCFDYGGRDEILRAVNKMLKSGIKDIDEQTFGEYLDTAGIPDPDLIIRTSGEKRISGLMPFQSSYSELYFSDIYFPDFDALELRKAIKSFGKRIRRFGGTAKEDLK
jgi:undecaprenyl diphosphate synthase